MSDTEDKLVIETGDVRVSLTRGGLLKVRGCKGVNELGAVLTDAQMRALGDFIRGGKPAAPEGDR